MRIWYYGEGRHVAADGRSSGWGIVPNTESESLERTKTELERFKLYLETRTKDGKPLDPLQELVTTILDVIKREDGVHTELRIVKATIIEEVLGDIIHVKQHTPRQTMEGQTLN